MLRHAAGAIRGGGSFHSPNSSALITSSVLRSANVPSSEGVLEVYVPIIVSSAMEVGLKEMCCVANTINGVLETNVMPGAPLIVPDLVWRLREDRGWFRFGRGPRIPCGLRLSSQPYLPRGVVSKRCPEHSPHKLSSQMCLSRGKLLHPEDRLQP